MSARTRPSVADLRARKGRVPHTMPRYVTITEAAAAEAIALHDECRRQQAAGAFAVEIEGVPDAVASAISARLDRLLWSMGSGPECDAHSVFAEDISGENRGDVPRHAKVYRDFAAEHDRPQAKRVAAFADCRADVASGAFPGPGHVVAMKDAAHDPVVKGIGA